MILSSLLFLFLSLSAKAKDFYPHLVSNPQVLKPGHLALENAPGASLSSKWFVSSLGVGVFSRFQVGTVPLFYTIKDQKYNYNFKYQIIRGDAFNLSLGYTCIQFEFPGKYDFRFNYISLSTNFLKLSEYFKLGLTYNRASAYSRKYIIYTYKAEDEWAIDVMGKDFQKVLTTVSLNKTNQKGSSLMGETFLGTGMSLTYLDQWWRLKDPSFGINYLVDPKEFQLLFKIDF